MNVRNYKDIVDSITGKIDRLDQKQGVVDRVTKDIDNAFTKLTEIEKRIRQCDSQSSSLPENINLVQNRVDEIMKNGPKLTEAMSRLSELDSLLKDADSRMEQINSARQGIARTEERLQSLSKSIDDKFKSLQLITSEEIKKMPPVGNSHITPQAKESVKALKIQGWSIDEIADRMHLSPAEVELILDMEI